MLVREVPAARWGFSAHWRSFSPSVSFSLFTRALSLSLAVERVYSLSFPFFPTPCAHSLSLFFSSRLSAPLFSVCVDSYPLYVSVAISLLLSHSL